MKTTLALKVVYFSSLVSLVLALMLRGAGRPFWLALIAFLCVAATQVIFWSYTYPANRATANWTLLPSNWLELRRQWEYSHATSAVLDLIALTALVLSVLSGWSAREAPTPAGPRPGSDR
jgi:hypothetical protein